MGDWADEKTKEIADASVGCSTLGYCRTYSDLTPRATDDSCKRCGEGGTT